MGHYPLLPQWHHPNTKKNIEKGMRLTSKVATARTQQEMPISDGKRRPKGFQNSQTKEAKGIWEKERSLWMKEA